MWHNKHIATVVLMVYGLLFYPNLYCKNSLNSLIYQQLPIAIDHPSPKPEYVLEQLDNTSGISHSSVNTVFQDSDNLLWLGTWDGLNRYDGRTFKSCTNFLVYASPIPVLNILAPTSLSCSNK